MFDRLSDAFHGLFRTLSGKGAISEANVRGAMGGVRAALLDADVHLNVVDTFTQRVLDDALGMKVVEGVEPGQQIVKIVHDRLVELLGGTPETGGATPGGPALASDHIPRMTPGPTVVMLCGLQGSGKTTTAGKLAAHLKKRGRSVMLAAADLQRPAAVEQLEIVAQHVRDEAPGSARVEFYAEKDRVAEYGKAVNVAVGVCRRAVDQARKLGVDTVVLDTAGRLHVNDALMAELKQVQGLVQPHLVLLVVDAMTGQDALHSAKAFHAALGIDGVILTKFDSDTRGGAALSVKHVTGAPIRFIGTGERLDAIEEFHAPRIAGRILGMGDVVSLVEKAQEQVSQEEAERLNEKLARGQMTMDDFLGQLKTLRRMGPMKQLLGLLPGVGSMLKDVHIEDRQLDKVEGMINSMTKEERRNPAILNMSRKRRIAAGSATRPDEVGQMVRQFEAVSTLARRMSSMSASEKVRAAREMGRQGDAMLPGLRGMPGYASRGSTHTTSVKDRFKKRKR
ncbi:MAG: signal recognition particle protein [Phycisphaerae bacterium]|nr:signal recognition particle protein [Phycisphaerae bacterium]